jgi:hypothetical protein
VAVTYQGDSPLNTSPREAAGEAAAATGADRREHVRVRPDGNNQLAATLASGSDIHLIDLSRGGAQFECERRFLPNAAVSLRLRTQDGEVLVTGRVVRSRIVRLVSGGLGYLVAVAFAKELQTELDAAPPAARPLASSELADATEAAPPSVPPEPTLPAVYSTGIAAAAPLLPLLPTDVSADISADEALAFEAGTEIAPAMLMVTASVDRTSEQLHDMFNGNDW